MTMRGMRVKKNIKKMIKRVLRLACPTKTITFDGLKLTGAIEDYGFLKALAAGEREPYTCKLIAQRATPGALVVDVGAHLGHYSLIAGRGVGNSGKVLAFEPHPRNLKYLRQNIQDNDLSDHVVVVSQAISAQRGSATFYVDEFESDTSGLHQSSADSLPMQIETAPLSAHLPDGQLPSLIKVDVEGAELEVLSGMENIIENAKKAGSPFALVIECNDAALTLAGASAELLVQRLKKFGLKLFLIDERESQLIPLQEGAQVKECQNLFCEF